ncbi:MAG: S41 family peptidase [Bacteroidota bacterium]
MKRIIAICFGVLISFAACEEILIEKNPSNNPVTNFDILWNIMNDRYSFFEYKKIDWDSVYDVYRPQVTETTSDVALFDIMKEMLRILQDGHVNLRSDFDIVRFPDLYLDYPQNFNRDMLERAYWENDYRITGFLINREIQGVGYIYYGSFGAPVTDDDLDFVLERFKDLPALIIDIRNNEGGDPQYAFRMIERLINSRTHVYSHQFKSGPGTEEFSELEEIYANNKSGVVKWDKPVYLLTNRNVYSAANLFTAMMKAVPRVTQIGDWSGGGGGVPAGAELPNGWAFNFSSSILSMPDGFIIEHGLEPDIHVEQTPEDVANGVDPILDRAIELALNN